jgi:RNA polymerase sigma factor (sigma-70 family)
MSSAHVGAVLSYIRKLAADRNDLDLPDDQLLERFTAHRDEAAFAALLKRHGPMVLGVCQSILHNLHDAEDAFQAAFLVLARRAGSIHRREAVSAWLHRVAYHLAVDVQAGAARRRVLEKRAVAMPSADPLLDLSLRELHAVLHEELQRLPEESRAPLVLCCLEEKSLEEAGRLLGWSRWTVKRRLQRGREQLRARLRRRGLGLSAGLFAAALSASSASARLSAPLAASTVKAASWLAAGKKPAADVISAKVTALVQGASKAMFFSKGKIATILLLAAAIAATGFGVVRHQAVAADQPVAEQREVAKAQDKANHPREARPEPSAATAREVRGRVLGPDGNPVAGAKLYLAKHATQGPAISHQATSGADGRFHFAIAKSVLDNSPAQVMAVAASLGCDWASVGPAGRELSLRLVKDVPVRGRILDPDGRPVAGARITITGLSAPKGDDLGGYIEAVRKGYYQYTLPKNWGGPLPGQPAVRTTGADGRFRLAGAGRERVVNLHVEGPEVATVDLSVMTRVADPVKGAQLDPFDAARHVYGASFDYVAAASRPIRGVVRDKATGKPLAGVWVFVEYWVNPKYEVNPQKALTDQQGRYELLGLAKSPSRTLAVRPPDGQLYFQRQIGVHDTPGLAPLTVDIDMVRGLPVRGKVTDKVTGKPVAHAMVEYRPLYANPHVNKLSGMWTPRSESITGRDGSYVLTVLPGPGVLAVEAPKPDAYMPALVTLKERKKFFKLPLAFDGFGDNIMVPAVGGNAAGAPIAQDRYNATVLLEPGEKDETLVKDIVLERAQEQKGRVLGPDGRPLAGVTVTGLVQDYDTETLKGAEFTIRRINPKAKRQIVFHRQDKNLGFILKELPRDNSKPLTVKLQPCGSMSGRMVDKEGQPRVGLRIDVGGHFFGAGMRELVTDKDGRFRAEGLLPGGEYGVCLARLERNGDLAHVVIEPGKHKDVGDIKPGFFEK